MVEILRFVRDDTRTTCFSAESRFAPIDIARTFIDFALMLPVAKPRHRSRLRKAAAREYYILRRKLQWLAWAKKFARKRNAAPLPHSITTHRSMLLRPLKDVEMYLQHNKITNLRLAIERIDGVIIKPGETFSVWRLAGRPTARRGFLEGVTLENGRAAKGIGGGLCQLGNLIYWMALHSPLTVAERWRHSYDVFPDVNRTIPFACGATLSYNYIDLQLRNDTDADIQINLWLDSTHLNGEIRSACAPSVTYRVFETDHQIRHQWWGGYTRHNRIWRYRINAQGGIEATEPVAENHAIMMYNPLLEG